MLWVDIARGHRRAIAQALRRKDNLIGRRIGRRQADLRFPRFPLSEKTQRRRSRWSDGATSRDALGYIKFAALAPRGELRPAVEKG